MFLWFNFVDWFRLNTKISINWWLLNRITYILVARITFSYFSNSDVCRRRNRVLYCRSGYFDGVLVGPGIPLVSTIFLFDSFKIRDCTEIEQHEQQLLEFIFVWLTRKIDFYARSIVKITESCIMQTLSMLCALENFIDLRSIIKSQAISAGISNFQRFILGV